MADQSQNQTPASDQDIYDYGKYLLSQGHNPQEVGEYTQYLKSQTHQNDAVDNVAKGALNIAGRAANIPASLIRTGIGTPITKINDALSGKDTTSVVDDVSNAALGAGTPTKDYLTRLGVGDLGSAQLPAWMTREWKSPQFNLPHGGQASLPSYTVEHPTKVTGKDVLGQIGDALSQFYGNKAIGSVLENSGESAYKVPFRKQDAALAAEGKPELSPLLRAAGEKPTSAGDVTDAIQRTANKTAASRNALEAPAIASGETGSMENSVSNMQDLVDKMAASKSPYDRNLAVRLQKEIDAHLALGEQPEIPSTTINFEKQTVPAGMYSPKGDLVTKYRTKEVPTFEKVMTTDANPNPNRLVGENPQTEKLLEYAKQEKIPQNFYYGGESEPMQATIPGQAAQPGPNYKELRQVQKAAFESLPSDRTAAEWKVYNALGAGAAEEANSIADRILPGSGAAIRQKNAELSSLISSLPEAERKALLAASKAPVTQLDTLSAMIDPKLYIAKNIGRVLQTPAPWTIGGSAAAALGRGLQEIAPYAPTLEIMKKGNK